MAEDLDKIIPPDSVPVDYDISTSLPVTNSNNISKKAQTAALGRAPDAALGRAPDAALGRAPDAALGRAPDAALGRAPGAALSRAPDAALGRAPDAALNRIPGGDLLSQSHSLQDLRKLIPNVSNIHRN